MHPPDDPFDAVLRPPPGETPEETTVREVREAEARRVSAAIDADIRAERLARRKKRIVRLLLLGQSESGKSTTLRQFQRLYTPTAFRSERILWRAVIQLNIVRSIRTILDAISPDPTNNNTNNTSNNNNTSPRRRRPSVAPSVNMLALAASTSSPDAGHDYHSHSHSPSASDGELEIDADADSDPESTRFSSSPPPLPLPLPQESAHAALRTRLLPLRHIEALLIARLVPAHEDEPTRLDVPFNAAGRDTAKEIFVRPGNRWKGALGRGARSPERREARDEPQETLHACAPDLIALWGDPRVRDVLRRRKIRLEEGPGFFLDDLERVTGRDYLPTDDDVLRARLKTVGVSEYTFEMEVASSRETGTEWRIVDVGGTRYVPALAREPVARRLTGFGRAATWVPFFDDVDAIIFLAPISGFDEVLAEDRTVNRLEDSVLLWRALCANPLLASVDLVLFLNKCDLLERKLASGVKLARYVRSYADRENSVEAISTYLRSKFSAIHREYSPSPRKFYAFCTSVTDTATTGGIIASVRDMVVRQHLKQSKLL
ncbi:guanine nucleotide binding protein, alpha subunit [Mycena rosella]|uniref:Guanine nucleotide binding protein, alpha subunit n=1 Tax=Mycena rosella TaxID=1033263 RepID=A0AAD7D5V0_MYCRO|nr:guanine nucleotide binding protein, alpha subunit [Mycena rosella]